ncbi:MAG: single-stranded DNA-binding protein [Bacteroidetes bacterium]|nr:single-stranded DNA-binding protein [Bacteroidota bacterium]
MNTLKNKVQLLGYLGATPETRKLDNGNTLTKMRIATSDSYKNAQGELVTDTQWHTVIAWGKVAELAAQYLDKGSQVLVEGRLTYREYTAPDGQKRHYTEIVASELEFLSKRPAAVNAA